MRNIQERFVEHPEFATSVTRKARFQDLSDYLGAWSQVEATTGRKVLLALWLAGSFVSARLDPGDLDLTPVIDGVVADDLKGRPGSGGVRMLSKDRDYVKSKFRIEPFPVRWHPIAHPFESGVEFAVDEAAYLSDRGMMDDWWQRCKIDGEDEPSIESSATRRGYLEVVIG